MTSREPLGVPGERVWRVPGLLVGEVAACTLDPDRAGAAVELFVERARESASRFDPERPGVRAVIARALHAIDQLEHGATDASGQSSGPILTPREVAVLELVADGQSNRAIAAALHISASTAGVHVSNILRKLGARRRATQPGWPTRAGC